MSPGQISRVRDGRVSILFGLAGAVFAGAASMRILDALLPALARHYDQSVGTAGLTITAYALSYSVCQLLYGPLGDRLGPYRIICWTAGLSAGAALCCAAAPTLEWLVMCRFIAGGVAAAIGPLALAWIGHATTTRERPVMIARVSSASILGTTGGQMGGGLIGALFGWRASFLLIALLFAGAAMALVRIGMHQPGLKAIGRMADADAARTPRLRDLLARRIVRATLVCVGAEGFATYLSLTYAAALLQRQLGLQTAGAGMLVGFFGLGGISFAVLSRPLVARWPEARRAFVGGGLAAAGFGLLAVAAVPMLAALALVSIGFGFFSLHNVLQVRATHMARDAPGAAVSLFAATFFLAQALGASLGGWAFDRLGPATPCFCSALLLLAVGFRVGRSGPDAHEGGRVV